MNKYELIVDVKIERRFNVFNAKNEKNQLVNKVGLLLDVLDWPLFGH